MQNEFLPIYSDPKKLFLNNKTKLFYKQIMNLSLDLLKKIQKAAPITAAREKERLKYLSSLELTELWSSVN